MVSSNVVALVSRLSEVPFLGFTEIVGLPGYLGVRKVMVQEADADNVVFPLPIVSGHKHYNRGYFGTRSVTLSRWILYYATRNPKICSHKVL